MIKLIASNWKVISIVCLVLLVFILIRQNQNLKEDVLISKTLIAEAKNIPRDIKQPEVKFIEKPGGGNIVIQEVPVPTSYIPESVKKALRDSYIKDTIIAALKKQNEGKELEILSITRTLGEAHKKLAAKDLVNTSKNDSLGILEWNTDFYTSRVNIAERTNEVKYRIKVDNIQVKETSKGFLGTGLFKTTREYMVGTSPDPGATFDGMIQMRTHIKPKYDPLSLSVELGGKYFLKPYNQLDVFTGIRVTLNPDGRWQPSFSGQYIMNTVTGVVIPAVEARLSYTIFE